MPRLAPWISPQTLRFDNPTCQQLAPSSPLPGRTVVSKGYLLPGYTRALLSWPRPLSREHHTLTSLPAPIFLLHFHRRQSQEHSGPQDQGAGKSIRYPRNKQGSKRPSKGHGPHHQSQGSWCLCCKRLPQEVRAWPQWPDSREKQSCKASREGHWSHSKQVRSLHSYSLQVQCGLVDLHEFFSHFRKQGHFWKPRHLRPALSKAAPQAGQQPADTPVTPAVHKHVAMAAIYSS